MAQLHLFITNGPLAGNVHPIRKERVVIGRDRSADISLKVVGASREHCLIRMLDGGGIAAEDMGSRNGTKVNGTIIEGERTLQAGDRITIGTTDVLVADDRYRGQSRLRLMSGDAAGKEIPLTGDAVTIGRSQKATIILDDKAASGVHCRLQSLENNWHVTDLKANNGTMLNGERIAVNTPLPLRSGDYLQIGSTLLSFIDGRIEDLDGESLGSTTLIRRIHAGSVGIVYHGKLQGSGRDVAVKIVDPVITQQVKEKARLLNGARNAARLDDEHIAAVIASGEERGLVYIVSDWAENGSLEDMLSDDIPPPMVTASLLLDSARGLHAAEQQRIFHHGIRPGNILIFRDGMARVTDFATTARFTGHITSGDVIPHYAAPEEFTGAAVSALSNQYSLGAVAYHALTGDPPFANDDGSKAEARIAGALPDPREFNKDVPAALSQVVARMMAIDPDNRYASWQELIDDLQKTLDTQGRCSIAAAKASAIRVGSSSSAARRSGAGQRGRGAAPRVRTVHQENHTRLIVGVSIAALAFVAVLIGALGGFGGGGGGSAYDTSRTLPSHTSRPGDHTHSDDRAQLARRVESTPSSPASSDPGQPSPSPPPPALQRDSSLAPSTSPEEHTPSTRETEQEDQPGPQDEDRIAPPQRPLQQPPPQPEPRIEEATDAAPQTPPQEALVDSLRDERDQAETDPESSLASQDQIGEEDAEQSSPSLPRREGPLSHFARANTWEDGTVVLTDGTEKGTRLRFMENSSAFEIETSGGEQETIPEYHITEVRLAPPNSPPIRRGDNLLQRREFERALAAYADAEERWGDEPYLKQQIHTAQQLQKRLNRAEQMIINGTMNNDGDAVIDGILVYLEIMEPRRLSPPLAESWTSIWPEIAGRLDDARRNELMEIASNVGVRLHYDEQAPEILAEAIELASGDDPDYRQASSTFQRAVQANAWFDSDARIAYARTLLATGNNQAAARWLQTVDSRDRSHPEYQKLALSLGLRPPELQPELLVSTYIGGRGNQSIRELEIRNGVVHASGEGFQVAYQLSSLRGAISGDIHHDEGDARYRNRSDVHPGTGVTLEDPRSGESYRIRMRQVHSILQQPILTSTAGWTAYGQNYEEIHSGTRGIRWGPLMADSRGYDVWIMPDGHIGAKFWTDGGNSILTRNPFDITQPNPIESMGAWQRHSSGHASLFLRIDPTGSEPKVVGGTFVPSHVTYHATDPWGRTYLPLGIRSTDFRFGSESGGGGLFVLDPNLTRPELNIRFGGSGDEMMGRIALEDNILVLGGRTQSKDLITRNAVQEQHGGGTWDAWLVIIRLWPQPR
ncbi:MAG: FHA domain-containing protein [Planctomycetota bacterium]|nr:MAG: FHA domain-containing protein [Planctomycetota bacterium]